MGDTILCCEPWSRGSFYIITITVPPFLKGFVPISFQILMNVLPTHVRTEAHVQIEYAGIPVIVLLDM